MNESLIISLAKVSTARGNAVIVLFFTSFVLVVLANKSVGTLRVLKVSSSSTFLFVSRRI